MSSLWDRLLQCLRGAHSTYVPLQSRFDPCSRLEAYYIAFPVLHTDLSATPCTSCVCMSPPVARFWSCKGEGGDCCVVGGADPLHNRCKVMRLRFFLPVFAATAVFVYLCISELALLQHICFMLWTNIVAGRRRLEDISACEPQRRSDALLLSSDLLWLSRYTRKMLGCATNRTNVLPNMEEEDVHATRCIVRVLRFPCSTPSSLVRNLQDILFPRILTARGRASRRLFRSFSLLFGAGSRLNALLGGSVLHPRGGGYALAVLVSPALLSTICLSGCASVWLYAVLVEAQVRATKP